MFNTSCVVLSFSDPICLIIDSVYRVLQAWMSPSMVENSFNKIHRLFLITSSFQTSFRFYFDVAFCFTEQ
jgi:hypothetical protein